MAWVGGWFDVVRDVTIIGSPEALEDAEGKWNTQFSRIHHIADSLRDGVRDQQQAWNSPAGQAFGAHLESIAKASEELEQQLKPVLTLLTNSETSLTAARAQVPIPDVIRSGVLNAHIDFLNTGELVLTCMHTEFSVAKDLWDATVNDAGGKAEQAADKLNSDYKNHNDNTSSPQFSKDGSAYTREIPNLDGTDGPTAPHGLDGLGAGNYSNGIGPGADPSEYAGSGLIGRTSMTTGTDSANGLHSGIGAEWDSTSANPWDQFRDGTGLASAGGGSGFSGSGFSGLGSPGGLGGALGGASMPAAGIGSGTSLGNAGLVGGDGGFGGGLTPSTALGPSVSTKAGLGQGGGTARGASSANGMMAGPSHGGGIEGGDGRDTWLTEDDDVWGTNDLPGIRGGTIGGGYF